ncbi:MAG TPA: CcmD family protein [Candidatus Sulfotelmatobacter sp.]|nr:CcmD family protein [Candidatus Sulfotelmatobacter sp.]
MKSYAFLFWGYLVVWIGLVGYLASLGRRMTALARRIERLENRREA